MGLKLESWAQPVAEEMERNGYLLIVTLPIEGPIRVTFAKGNVRGAAKGNASEYSFLVVRAAIAAYREEALPRQA
jgi:hypothetical protein